MITADDIKLLVASGEGYNADAEDNRSGYRYDAEGLGRQGLACGVYAVGGNDTADQYESCHGAYHDRIPESPGGGH